MRPIPQHQLLDKLGAALRDGKMVRETLYQVVAMFLMLRDPEVPVRAKAEVVAALIYLLNPFDLVPDLLPMGLADDVAVLGVTWTLIQRHITEDHRRQARRIIIDLLNRLNLTKEIPADGKAEQAPDR